MRGARASRIAAWRRPGRAACFVRSAGRGDRGRRRSAADAGRAQGEDPGRDHLAEYGLHDGRRRV